MREFKLNKILLVLFILFLFSCSKSHCNPEECVRNEIYCEENKIINITYACIDDNCAVFKNNSLVCKSLDNSLCANKSIMHLTSYNCVNAKCIREEKTVDCKPQFCLDNKCNLNCGNNIIDKGENCKNCPEDVNCKEDENCLNSICVPKNQEVKVCFFAQECDDNNPCTYDDCDRQKGKCINLYFEKKVPSFCKNDSLSSKS